MVITTLIIILFVLVAVGIVWVVVKNIISESAEQVTLGKLTMDLEIKKVTVNDGSVDVQVKRNPGAGELSGIKFIISDGVDTQVFEEATTMKELATKTFILSYTGLVKEVSIAGIFETASGKEFTGNEIDTYVVEEDEAFSVQQIIENLGAVSWWRFEGDALDEIGENHGAITGASWTLDGKFGGALEFDGVDDYVWLGDTLRESPVSIAMWFKTTDDGMNLYRWRSYGMEIVMGSYYTPSLSPGEIAFKIQDSGATVYLAESIGKTYNDDEWHFVAGVYNGTYVFLYVDGEEIDRNPAGTLYYSNGGAAIGRAGDHSGGYFNGSIDEVAIWNRSLSADEIKELYELELS